MARHVSPPVSSRVFIPVPIPVPIPVFHFVLLLLAGLLLAPAFGLDLASPAHAWSRGGHQVIGSLASDRLTPEARAETERLLGLLAHVEPRSESIPDASSWLDQLRHGGLRTFDDWHWVNLPLEADGSDYAPAEPRGRLVEVTRKGIRVLEDPASDEFARAFMLRVLLHTVGDAHQPLHCVARYSSEFPEGDRGGNGFEVDDPDNQWENLHFLWDFGLGLLPQVHGELGAEDLGRLVEEIGAQPLSPALAERAKTLDPHAWCEEGLDFAGRSVYAGIEEGGRPSDEYIAAGRELTRRQLRLAAERLARLLNRAFAESGARDAEAQSSR